LIERWFERQFKCWISVGSAVIWAWIWRWFERWFSVGSSVDWALGSVD